MLDQYRQTNITHTAKTTYNH